METTNLCLNKYNLPFDTQQAILLYGGSRSKVYLVGENIVRIPTQNKFLIEQKREAEISQIIQNNISVDLKNRIAAPVFTGTCTYHKQIKGNLLNSIFDKLTFEEKKNLARDIAQLLFAIHSIAVDKFETRLVKYDKVGRNENKTILEDFDYGIAQKHILKCSNNILNLDDFKTDIPPFHLALCHNDLHAENIIIDENHKLSGFIDFGETDINSSINDFFHSYRLEGNFARNVIKEYNRLTSHPISTSAADYQFLSNTGYQLEKRKENSSFSIEVQKVLRIFL